MTKVMLGAPVRDRAWILPRFIKHVKAMNLEGIELDTLFIANDCIDNTIPLLKDAGFHVKVFNDLPSKTMGSVRGQYGYFHLANLRNILVEEFLKTDNEYLFSIDTDILVPPHGLVKLLQNRKDICSMLLCNQPGEFGKRAHNIMNETSPGYFSHITTWREGELLEVGLTGAVYLIHRKVFEAGVRYAYSAQGEDTPFCLKAKEKGFKLYCDTSLKPVHVMSIGVELVGGCDPNYVSPNPSIYVPPNPPRIQYYKVRT